MRKPYVVDFASKTITLTAEFEKAMSDPNSSAYQTIQKLCADFPDMRIVRRTHPSPLHQQAGRCIRLQSLQEPDL